MIQKEIEYNLHYDDVLGENRKQDYCEPDHVIDSQASTM